MYWNIRDNIQADFSKDSFGERKQTPIEHFLTRTELERPLCVRSFTIFADLDRIVRCSSCLGPWNMYNLIRIIKYVSDIWKPTVRNGEVDKIHKLRISLRLSIHQLRVFKILGLCKKSINAVVRTAHTRRSRFEYAAKTLKREVIVLVPFYLVYTGNELSIEETLHCQVSFFWRLWGCKQAPRCWSLLCSNHWA